MIYLIDKVLPESYFANNLRALSGKHKDTHTSRRNGPLPVENGALTFADRSEIDHSNQVIDWSVDGK